MQQIAPSRPGYNFSSADVARASISPEELGKIILQSAANDPTALLAALLKAQVPMNSKYRPVPYNFSAYSSQLVLAENPKRNYLMIQNVGSNDLMVIFEDGPATVQDFSADADSQQLLINQQTRALRVVAGGYFEPLVPPKNSITLFTLNGATNGVVIDGGQA